MADQQPQPDDSHLSHAVHTFITTVNAMELALKNVRAAAGDVRIEAGKVFRELAAVKEGSKEVEELRAKINKLQEVLK